MEKIHFISGLPRSGSTLLGALLRQNPRFHAGMSSPIASMFCQMQNIMSGRNEYHVFIDDAKREAILRGIFCNYYGDLSPDTVVFDTNRAWSSKLHALNRLFPSARVICCVRSLVWVIDSIERIVQKNSLEPSRMFNFESGGNVFTRAETLNAPNGLIGAPYAALKEAFFGEHKNKIVLLTYDSLAKEPTQAMRSIYEFLEEEPYEHDFEHVEFDADEFDIRLGTPGLHRVASRVEWRERESVLPPDLIARYVKSAFWMDCQSDVRVI